MIFECDEDKNLSNIEKHCTIYCKRAKSKNNWRWFMARREKNI